MRIVKITDDQFIQEYVTNGLGLNPISKKYSINISALGKRLDKLERDGRIPPGLRDSRRQTTAPRIPEAELAEMYKERGAYSISKEFGISTSSLLRRLHRMGVVDSSRQYQPTGLTRRTRRPKSVEFLDSTKKQRFTEESGCCQECKKPIGDGVNWRLATYHHIKMVCDGGGPEPENCMVLHQECHEHPEVYPRLHKGKSLNRLSEAYKRMVVEGQPSEAEK